jgi:acyl-CoA dehydrogenase
MVAEAHGGVGLTPTDALQVIRRAGYHTLPVPLAETMIAAALWTQAGGDAPHGTLSLGPTRAADSVALEPISDGYVLHGSAARIPWGANVDHVLLYAHTGSGTGHLVLLPRGTVATQARRNLAFEPRDTLVFTGTSVPKTAVRPAAMAGGLLPFGALIRAQQLVGAMERCLDHAIGYAMERKQFGRPIGKFQAIQQMLADAAGQYAAASAAADLAAHGAMGFTQEHPLHFATRRLWSWRDEFGNDAYWQERLGRLVCSRGADALWPMLVGM